MIEKPYFTNPNDTANSKLQQHIRNWVKDKFLLQEPFDVSVAEIKCSDPGCPDIDTHITLTVDGKSRKFRIAKPLVYVRKWDIESMKEITLT